MELNQLLLIEAAAEYPNTRKMLERIPTDKLGWKPHEKSMTLKQLAVHLAELPQWSEVVLNTPGIDFANFKYIPTPVETTEDILRLFDEKLAAGTAALKNATNQQLLEETWQMSHGDHIISNDNKYMMVRHAFGQNIHHRAQLGVYLRLLNVPIPGVYGPSADES